MFFVVILTFLANLGKENQQNRRDMYFERKIIDGKSVEKKVNKVIASAGDADPGQGGFLGGSQAGRDPARLRSSSGWAGGLFALRVTRRGRLKAWRLGGLEAWRPGEKERWLFRKKGAEG